MSYLEDAINEQLGYAVEPPLGFADKVLLFGVKESWTMAIEDWLLRNVASAAGVPSPLVAEIEKEVPTLARICRNAKLLSPIVNEATPIIKKLIPKLQAISEAPVKEALPMLADLAPLIDDLKPLFGQAMAIIGPEEGDIEEVAPVITQLVDFFNKKYPTTLGGGTE